MRFRRLFEPGTIGRLTLKNRLIMPAMGVSLADAHGGVTNREIDYYAARANGGVAMVTPHYASVSVDSSLPYTMVISDDGQVKNWKALADAVHAGGARFSIQLMHIGMIFLYSGHVPKGVTIKVPSMTQWLKRTYQYHVVTEAEIERYIGDFAQAARRAKEAGADAVELHACHGCLVSTFMSPLTNKRTDQYGGSVENRVRFARRIVESMKEVVGKDFPIIVRMNASDDIEGGVSIDEAMEQAAILERAGADAISVSSGMEFWTPLGIPAYPFPEGAMIPLAEKIKQAVKVPVIGAGKITPELAEKVLEEGKVDFVAMGRPLLADPELPNKLREGRREDVRNCLYCNNCLRHDTQAPSCTVNPFLFRESRYPMAPAARPKRVMVVGGGLAGMETAIYLAERGHRVTIYEKTGQLGGQWITACASPGKDSYRHLTEYLDKAIKRLKIPVKLNHNVTREEILKAAPDTVILATGAVPVGLKVPGADKKHVVQGHDVLAGKVEVKGTSAVVGGRFIGMEVAVKLAEEGKPVCIITRNGLGEDGVKLEKFTFQSIANRLIELRVPLYLHATVVEIADKSVIILMNGEIYPVPADTVIFSVGMRSVADLAAELEGTGIEFHLVGDCVKPRDACEVHTQAAKIAALV
ncbi:MAG: FAD-dependent oxidoreductase [Dehalococcoidia bacterium]|nr:FAD-dependent oxidoreductase [Dehalococcoidia bacterium]